VDKRIKNNIELLLTLTGIEYHYVSMIEDKVKEYEVLEVLNVDIPIEEYIDKLTLKAIVEPILENYKRILLNKFIPNKHSKHPIQALNSFASWFLYGNNYRSPKLISLSSWSINDGLSIKNNAKEVFKDSPKYINLIKANIKLRLKLYYRCNIS